MCSQNHKENKEEDERYAKQLEASRDDAKEQYPKAEAILNELFDELLRDDEAEWHGSAGFCVMVYHKARDFSLRISYADKRFRIDARKGHYLQSDRNVFVNDYQNSLMLIKYTDYMQMNNKYTKDRCFERFIRNFVSVFG